MRHRRDPVRQEILRIRLMTGLALALLLLGHLRPVFRVTVAGEELPGRYTLLQTERCLALARETAEEILPAEAELPELRRRFSLSLSPSDGEEARLVDALLRGTRGVAVAEEVRVNGQRLGTVDDGRTLVLALERSIRAQMPLVAVSGSISGKLELRRVYTRTGPGTKVGDMVLLITGMAPVIYLDAQGRLA